MPARIVVVHDDPKFRQCAVAALQAAGYDVEAFPGSMEAINALDAAEGIDLLITRVMFPPGTPNGVSLARMARMKKPGIRVLFAARDENREHTEGVGEFLTIPVSGSEIAATVTCMLTRDAG
jgi:DNA-binding response OmpR family regulator